MVADLAQLPEWVPRWAFWLILAGLSLLAAACAVGLAVLLSRE